MKKSTACLLAGLVMVPTALCFVACGPTKEAQENTCSISSIWQDYIGGINATLSFSDASITADDVEVAYEGATESHSLNELKWASVLPYIGGSVNLIQYEECLGEFLGDVKDYVGSQITVYVRLRETETHKASVAYLETYTVKQPLTDSQKILREAHYEVPEGGRSIIGLSGTVANAETWGYITTDQATNQPMIADYLYRITDVDEVNEKPAYLYLYNFYSDSQNFNTGTSVSDLEYCLLSKDQYSSDIDYDFTNIQFTRAIYKNVLFDQDSRSNYVYEAQYENSLIKILVRKRATDTSCHGQISYIWIQFNI